MKSWTRLLIAGFVISPIAAAATGIAVRTKAPAYPATRKVEVVEDYHGTPVADPYRWLEDLGSPQTRGWIAAQNAITFKYLEAIPLREAIRKRITELWDYPKVTVPVEEGGKFFYRKNSGLQRQSVLHLRSSLGAEPKVLLDPNELSPDGSVSLSGYSPSPDARYATYSLSEGGADWQVVHLRDVATGRDLPEVLRWVRFSGISWTKDGRGFFYARYPEPRKGEELSAPLVGQKLYYHRVGTEQSKDPLIYERKDLPTWFLGGDVSEDGRYLFVYLARGSEPKNRLYCADLGDPKAPRVQAPIRPLVEEDDAEYAPLGNVKSTLFLRTDLDAPRRRVISFDLTSPARKNWKTVVPESTSAIEDAVMAGGRLVLHHLVDVRSRLRLFSLAGKPETEVALPGVGTVTVISGRNDSADLFYVFTSPLTPATVIHHDLRTGKGRPFEAPSSPFDSSRYETKQVFYRSKDGTRVPMFITARKGLARDGRNPTLLEAYGGFSVSETPTYSPDVPAWLELGGVYATANLRGGGEYGEDWHRSGMKEKKQNVFDDFIAAAEFLIREKYTSPEKLAIQGASNGGLLVGAVMEQRPDLFGVALPEVGVMDMLRYQKFTGGTAWVGEYGSAEDPAAFAYLKAYSPLHNVKPGTCYPATLVTTADFDDRVVPSHSYKFTAAMQLAQGCDRPVLIRVETKGSHGYLPTDKRIAALADEWAFAAANLGVVRAR